MKPDHRKFRKPQPNPLASPEKSRKIAPRLNRIGDVPKPTGPMHVVITYKQTKDRRVRYTWVFDNMILREPDGRPADGSTVFVHDEDGKFLGSGIYNSRSRIRIRIFSLNRQEMDAGYVRAAVISAVARRLKVYKPDESFRVVFSDSDMLPGLIADKIGPVIIVQILTMAMDSVRNEACRALMDSLPVTGIVQRLDTPVRSKEGLPMLAPEIIGEIPEIVRIVQDDVIMYADPRGGQKTGLFLDQRDNRFFIRPWCKGARVLDLFCHAGGWAFNAAIAGAAEVVGVDVSEPVIKMAEKAAGESGYDQVNFVCADVFDFLKETATESHYDVIVCDPPAFAKTKLQVTDAVKAYLTLNYRAMKLLAPGGILASCSCSQSLGWIEFEHMLMTAARNARMQFQVIRRSPQPIDHSPLLGFPESEYLKVCFLQRIE